MDKEVRRTEIIEAARTRFRRQGIRKTTMHEIAEDLRISVGSLYLYFKSKDELVLGCAERFTNIHKDFAAQVQASEAAPEEKLRTYIIGRYRAVEEARVGSSYSAEIARAVLKLSPERYGDDDQMLYENVLLILHEGIAKGVFVILHPERDAEIFVQSIIYFLPVAGTEIYRPPSEAKLLAMTEWFIDKWKTYRVRKVPKD